jgi:hypothetical protein
VLAGLVPVLASCGETTVDSEISAAASTTTTTPAPISPDAPLDELIAEVVDGLAALPELVIENEGDEEALARVLEAWAIAEPQVRSLRPELLFGFEQAVLLGSTAVERRRPADASKGYKLAVDLAADLARA